jgi:hypothetical protein
MRYKVSQLYETKCTITVLHISVFRVSDRAWRCKITDNGVRSGIIGLETVSSYCRIGTNDGMPAGQAGGQDGFLPDGCQPRKAECLPRSDGDHDKGRSGANKGQN